MASYLGNGNDESHLSEFILSRHKNLHIIIIFIKKNPDFKKHKIYHYTSTDKKKRANAAYLMGAYLIICKQKPAEEAWSFFENVYPPFMPFRDAICGECTYACTVSSFL